MAKRWLWPQCTLPDCRHVRTYTDEADLDRDMAVHGEEWTRADGHAVCHCHGTWDAFPCDQEAPESPVVTEETPGVLVVQAPAAQPVQATCAACGGVIMPATELDSGWTHLETKRDYRHPAWPAEQ
jgi:hypothetical protein